MQYREKLKKADKIVIKVGSSTLTYSNGRLNFNRLEKLARVLTDLRNQGKKVILVSSGSIVVGNEKLGLTKRSEKLPEVQAAAAIGQAVLMKIYQKFLKNIINWWLKFL